MAVTDPVRICLWSGPRNISTATMRSFEARPDCAVWDEPFYGWFLNQTGVEHPGRAETLAIWPTDPHAIAKACSGPAPDGQSEFFQKHMCQHMIDGTPLGWTQSCRHIFLIRDPAEVAASFYATTGFARANDLGAVHQQQLYNEIAQITGRDWPVIEGCDVLDNPSAMLTKLCESLDLAFHDSMLSWPAGRRTTDGPWAPYWYERVDASTGFEKPSPSGHDLPNEALPAVEESRPAYDALRSLKLTL